MLKNIVILIIGLVLGFMLGASLGTAYAHDNKVKLSFSHPSSIMACNDLDAVIRVFEMAQNKMPVQEELDIVGKCFGEPTFSSPLNSEIIPDLKRISATALDWEGDTFAVFSFREIMWLIIYNPDELDNLEVNH